MEKIDFLFEKMFANQIAKMTNFPEDILMTLISKKELLKERITFLGLEINENSFVPVIPTGKMKAIEQVARLVYYSHSPSAISEIYSWHLNGFFYNEPSAVDFSPVREIGWIIDVKTFPLSFFPSELYLDGAALRGEINKEGYTPTNHTEAFMLVCHTDLLPVGSSFCALNFSWDNFEFAQVCRGQDLKYGLWWITPSIKGKIKADNVLVPAYKEFI